VYDDCWLKLNRGDLKGALAETETSLQSIPSRQDEWRWRFLVLKAEILVRQRFSEQALTILEPELPLALRTGDVEVWRKLTQGTAHAFLLHFDVAQELLTEAQSLASTNAPALTGEVALRQGTLDFLRGDTSGAGAAYRKALASSLHSQRPFLQAAALGSLGLVATREGHYDESIDRDEAALQLSRSLEAQSSVARILGNLGWSYFEMGDYERSLSLFEEIEESFAKSGVPGMQSRALIMMGLAHYYLREFVVAEGESRKALEMARKMQDREALIECLDNISLVAISTGRLGLAEQVNSEARETARSTQNRNGDIFANLILARIQLARRTFLQAEHLLAAIENNEQAPTALRWEAEARLAKVYDEEGQTGKAEAEYKRSIATIQAARHSVGQDELRLTFLSSAIDFYDDYVDFLMQHHRMEDALRIADLTRSQTLVEGLASSSKSPVISGANQSPRELARKLHATLLVYWLGQSHSYLWVVTPTKVAHFPLPAKSQIDPTVKSYRQAIIDGRDVLNANADSGEQLYATLVAPAQKLIPQNSRVILFPAESLYGLNFETLIVPSPTPHFWIEDVTLSTASALAMPPSASQQKPGKQKSLLLVGDPEPASADFPRLAQAPAEMQKISNHFAQANRDVLEGPRATPASYLSSNPGRFSYLHFVTHGTASHTRPLESAVILSKEGDSYKLYARDIVQHRLNAELVTISACNGAGTRAYAGEGLVGLSWAFLRAGAHNVIGALWEVSDASSTPQLMDAMYGGIDKGQDPATALRNAKLAILHSGSASVFKKPFYWAPFQLYSGS
jgi:CHAT domain-containing protein